MRFEWDAAKRVSNIAKHGIDFVLVRLIFDGRPRCDFESARGAEDRIVSIANLNERFVAVIWIGRDDGAIRIISARRARHGEERTYRQLFR